MPRGIPNNPKPKVTDAPVSTWRARRTQRIGFFDREGGELVPEAYDWPRLYELVTSGYLDNVTVPESELYDAINRYCPSAAEYYGLPVDQDSLEAHRAVTLEKQKELGLLDEEPEDESSDDDEPQGTVFREPEELELTS